MPRNPFDDPLLQPTAVRIAGLLVLAALLIVIVERGNLARWRESVLFQRVSSWAMMAPVFSISVFTGGIVALALVAFLSVQGIREYAKLVRLETTYRWALIMYGLFALGVTGYFGIRFFLFLPLGFFGVATVIPIIRMARPDRDPFRELLQVAAAILGYVWIPLFLSFFILIGRAEDRAVALLLIFGLTVALSDVLAFTTGKIAGGPKLAPNVSPNKTWAGAAGNVAGAYLAFWLMDFAILPDWSNATRYLLPLLIALGALWGDLVESLVKRGFHSKDAGDLLPGFGGLLDRIDSLLLAMPLGYYAMKVLQHYTI